LKVIIDGVWERCIGFDSLSNGPPMSHVTSGLPISHVTSDPPISHVTSGLPISHVASGPPISHVTSGPPISHVTSDPPIRHVTSSVEDQRAKRGQDEACLFIFSRGTTGLQKAMALSYKYVFFHCFQVAYVYRLCYRVISRHLKLGGYRQMFGRV